VQADCTVFPERVCDKFAQFSGTAQAAGKQLKNDSFGLYSHECTGSVDITVVRPAGSLLRHKTFAV